MDIDYTPIRYSEREWLEIFPDAKERVKELISENAEVGEVSAREIYEDLTAICKLDCDWFSKWFAKEIIKTFKVGDFNKLRKDYKRLSSTMSKENMNKVNEAEIAKAKMTNWNELLDITRGFAHCPFHADIKASLHITNNNRAYCFSCGWSGDQIKLLQDRDKLSFPEAVLKLQ